MKHLLAACLLALPGLALGQAWGGQALGGQALGSQTLYVTDQAAGVSTVDARTLTVTGQIATGDRGPRGVAVTHDGKLLLVANQETADLTVLDRATARVLRHIPIGPSTEMVRVDGHTAFATYEPPADKGGLAHIAVIDLDSGKQIASVTSGHETEGLEFSPDGKYLLVTNEGDNTISIYDRHTWQEFKAVKVAEYGQRPRGIKRLPDGSGYVVTLEFSSKFIVLDRAFNVMHAISTGEGPYGVAFSPDGSRLFVAAAKSDILQAFDAKTYAHISDVKVGKRCWHFTFTPDGSHIVAACGRSGALFVIDPVKMTGEKTIDGFKMPWGIVSYPPANGTLQTP